MNLLILIDGGYLSHIARRTGARPDLSQLPNWVRTQIATTLDAPLTILRTIYYHSPPYQSASPTPQEAQRRAQFEKFTRFLQSLPQYHLRLGRLVRHYDARGNPRYEQKRVDVLLAVDMLSYALTRQVADIALIAGDSDFIPAVERAREAGVRIWLFHGPRGTYHKDLYAIADGRIPLTTKKQALYPTR